MILLMDMNGICVSSGSACTSGSLDPSHVLMALGLKHEQAHGSLRMTLGKDNTEAHIEQGSGSCRASCSGCERCRRSTPRTRSATLSERRTNSV